MKLKDLYTDIYSRLSLFDVGHGIYAQDIIKAINDAIRQQMIDYVNNDMGQAFAVEQQTYSVIESNEYPYAGYFTLSRPVLQTSPIENAILSAIVWRSSEEILDSPSSANIGDLAIKDNNLYKCIETFEDLNTYDRTFQAGNIRNYYRKNGLVYKEGDVVFDAETRDHYRCVEDFKANVDDDIENIPQFEKLYWYKIGSAQNPAVFYPMDRFREAKIFEDKVDSAVFSVRYDRVYVVPVVERVSLTYVPEWEEVVDMDKELKIPGFIIPSVKNDVLNILGAKLGGNLVDQRISRPEPEQNEQDERQER